MIAFGEPLSWFAWRMAAKLDANAHKGSWRELSPFFLLHRLRQETAELARALHSGAAREAIIDEAADVANFAMMIADMARAAAPQATALSEAVRALVVAATDALATMQAAGWSPSSQGGVRTRDLNDALAHPTLKEWMP